jgi:hypothetical protein
MASEKRDRVHGDIPRRAAGATALAYKPLQMPSAVDAGALVRAGLAPHHRVDRQLGRVGRRPSVHAELEVGQFEVGRLGGRGPPTLAPGSYSAQGARTAAGLQDVLQDLDGVGFVLDAEFVVAGGEPVDRCLDAGVVAGLMLGHDQVAPQQF